MLSAEHYSLEHSAVKKLLDTRQREVTYMTDRLNAVGIDGKGLARFFERLLTEYEEDTENPVLRLISSHPPTKERMDFIRARTTASGKAMTVEEWKDLKWACLITGDKPKR